MITLTATAPDPLSRTTPSDRPPLRVGLVQHRWRPGFEGAGGRPSRRHRPGGGRGRASGLPARDHAAALPGRHPGRRPIRVRGRGSGRRTDLRTGRRGGDRQRHLRARLAVRERRADDGLGYNTAILVSPAGELVARTRKLHIPISAGYYEDTYFRAGPADEATRTRCTSPTVWAPASACRPAGTNGSRKWPATTHSAVPKSSSTQRRSAPSRCSPRSTRSRCGSR